VNPDPLTPQLSLPANPRYSSSQSSVRSTPLRWRRASFSALFWAELNSLRRNRDVISRSARPKRFFIALAVLGQYRLISSSSMLTIAWAVPGSPCLAARP
jgi:hypothetical protein